METAAPFSVWLISGETVLLGRAIGAQRSAEATLASVGGSGHGYLHPPPSEVPVCLFSDVANASLPEALVAGCGCGIIALSSQ